MFRLFLTVALLGLNVPCHSAPVSSPSSQNGADKPTRFTMATPLSRASDEELRRKLKKLDKYFKYGNYLQPVHVQTSLKN